MVFISGSLLSDENLIKIPQIQISNMEGSKTEHALAIIDTGATDFNFPLSFINSLDLLPVSRMKIKFANQQQVKINGKEIIVNAAATDDSFCYIGNKVLKKFGAIFHVDYANCVWTL